MYVCNKSEYKKMKSTKLTEEITRAAIYYGLDHDLQIVDIYKICFPEDNTPNIVTAASQWKRGKRIAAIFESVKNEIEGRNEGIRKGTEPTQNGILPTEIDFTNKAEFIKYLNETANRLTDDKLKNDILKMLSDHLDFKDENKRDENNQIQRFYLPLRCQDCKLYQDAAKNVTL